MRRGAAPAHQPAAAGARRPHRLRRARRVPRHGRLAGQPSRGRSSMPTSASNGSPARVGRRSSSTPASLRRGQAHVDRPGRGVRRARHPHRRQHPADLLLARSTGSTRRPRPERSAEIRRQFRASFDGECKLAGRLHDIIGLSEGTADDGSPYWTMPSGEASQNGFGGLHGGVAFDLVTDAAVGGASRQLGPVQGQRRAAALPGARVGRPVPGRADRDGGGRRGGASCGSRCSTTARTPSCASSARSTWRCSATP